MVVPVTENSESEIGMIRDVNPTIKHEKVFNKRPAGGRIGIGNGRIGVRSRNGKLRKVKSGKGIGRVCGTNIGKELVNVKNNRATENWVEKNCSPE